MTTNAAQVRATLAACLVVAGFVAASVGVLGGLVAMCALGVLMVAGGALFGLARFAHRSGPVPVRRVEAHLAG